MRTSLCDRLGINVPIIQAAMGGASCPALAAAVSNAGGLGMLAPWRLPPEAIRDQIRQTRELTERPIGANFVLEWPQEERIDAALAEGVALISTFWGDPSALVERVHAGGALIAHTVGSAAEAKRAVDAGVDVIVAQGWEAGGHVWSEVASLPLVPRVVDAVPDTPVVAAGGISDGRGLAAVLALGAAGAWIGTRFLMSSEAAVHRRYRELLSQAVETDTFHGQLFDIGWPNASHRVLRNKTVEQWEAAGRPASGERPGEGEIIAHMPNREVPRYASATAASEMDGDIDALSLWAGQGVGLLAKEQPAAEIVREIVEEAEKAIAGLNRL